MSVLYSRFLALIFRAIFRLVLLLRNKSGLQTSPPIIPLDRGVELTEEGQFSLLCFMLIIISLSVVLEYFLHGGTSEVIALPRHLGALFPSNWSRLFQGGVCFYLHSSDDVTLEEQDEQPFVGQRSGRTIRPLGSCESATFLNPPLTN